MPIDQVVKVVQRVGRGAGFFALLWTALLFVEGPLPVLAQGDDVTVRKVVSTNNDDGTAFNGDIITYTIIVNNDSGGPIQNLVLLDVLPENVLDNVTCLDAPGISPCGLIVESREVPEPLGGTLTVTTTRQISWTIDALAANTSLQRSFSARVVGQGDGASFVNVAYLGFSQNGQSITRQSNDLLLRVLLRIEEGGRTLLSDSPTWFSEDVGGTLSMDWADFDGDGDLDLVLGSTLGTSVYRNNNGRMELFWSNTRPAYGVRWADVTGNGLPELVAVGAVQGGDTGQGNVAQQPGINYVYRYDAATAATNRRFVELSSFPSSVQLVRVEVGDFDNDGAVDLVASTNAINPDCAVQLFRNNGAGAFPNAPTCISRAATAALKPVDFDNDGDLDLVLGVFPNRVLVLINEDGEFDSRRSIVLEEGVMFLPYDFAWGDFNRDGYLDLAAAYPLMREVRIYRNEGGTGFARPVTLRTNVFLTPYALDWGDFSGDGLLDLAVADSPPIIYSYQPGSTITSSSFRPFFVLADNVVRGQVWSLRAVDQNGDGDIDLALSDRDGPSLVISNFRPPLNTTLTPIAGVPPFITATPSSSVLWADVDGDGSLDLIFGAGPSAAGPAALNTKIYYNDEGEFPPNAVRTFSGFGPHHIAVGDVDGDGDLDIALGTTSETRLHPAGDFLAPRWTRPATGDKHLAWGDVDGDKDLDLLVAVRGATTGYVALYLNDGTGTIGELPVWRENMPGVYAVAWGDFDGDGYLDFAAAVNGQNRIYRNNRDNSFSLAWTSDVEDNSRAVAWGDYDGDGDLDVVFGNYGPPGSTGEVNRLYENRLTSDNRRIFVEVPLAADAFRTTSLDWGDWDNDGDLDLAVGNYGQPDQIYVNSNSRPGAPQFFWLWSSSESLQTTGIAWGDLDNDGDLDLAISQDGNHRNGIYVNNLVVPSHLASGNFGVAALINPPMYLHAGRPGITADAYDYSSAEVLSGPDLSPVPVVYRIYNPDVAAIAAGVSMTESILHLQHEYSLDGGGTWRAATPLGSSLTPITDSAGVGLAGSFLWDAIRDQAISDNARFRVRLIQAERSGPVQRATAATITPPFRVRAITCIWPEGPDVQPTPVLFSGSAEDGYDYAVAAGVPIRFTGRVLSGTGALYFHWDFDDGRTAEGQVASNTFTNGTYRVRMSVRGEPCPQTRERIVTVVIRAGTGSPNIYLPLIGTSTGAKDEEETEGASVAPVTAAAAPPPQIRNLRGVVQVDSGDRWLRWEAPTPLPDAIRLYRGDRDAESLTLLAELAPDVTAYRDQDALCSQAYYVTSVLDGVESPPSTSLYVAPDCAVPCTQNCAEGIR